MSCGAGDYGDSALIWGSRRPSPALSRSGHCWVPGPSTLDVSPNPAGEIASTARSNDSYAYTGHELRW